MAGLLLDCLQGKDVSRPPFWFMRQAGRYLPEYLEVRAKGGDFLSLCYSPKDACEVTLQPIRRFGMDAAILFSDILVVPDAMGMDVSFVKGEGPKLVPIEDVTGVEALSVDIVGFLSPVYEAVTRIREGLDDTTALIGFSGAPWTLACYMLEGHGSKDFAKARTFAYQHPDGMMRLMDRLVDAVVVHLSEQIRAGAHVVQIFDSWAGVLSDVEFNRWVIDPTKRIVAKLRADFPDVPVIGFPRQAGEKYIRYIEETKVDAVSMDTSLCLDFASDQLQDRCVLQGNIDPILLAADKNKVIDQAKRIIETLDRNRIILNLGHGVIPETPIEHVDALSRFIREGNY